MSTVSDVVGKPIININGDWVKSSSFSSSSTVVLDPAAFLENWKKQIQGKHNIPVHQQRLTFASNHSPVSEINLFSWNSTTDDHTAHVPVVADFVTCLQSWEAILRSEKRNIARLRNPEVLTESDKLPSDLKSKAAEEFRNLGIPCSVYYLSFDKWILAVHSQNCQGTTQHCKELSSLCIQVDKDFQLMEYEVNLYGRLSKSSQPLHFSYNLKGRHVLAHKSMLEQTALYRQGQKMRHSLGKNNACIDKTANGSSAESLLEVDRTSTLLKQESGQDYYIPGSKDQELIAVIKNSELKCIVLPVITLDGPWERLQTLMCPINVFNEGKTLAPDLLTGMQRRDRKEANRARHLHSEHLQKSTTMNPPSREKIPECPKQKGLLSSKLEKTRCLRILDSEASNSSTKVSAGSSETDNSNASSSVQQYADSSKSNDLKRPPKKKKRKKGKRNLKKIVCDTSALPPKDSAQKSVLSSDVDETRVYLSEEISVCASLQDAGLFDASKDKYRNQNDIKLCDTKSFRTIPENANDPNVHTTPKDETADTHCSWISDLSNQNSDLLPSENSNSETFKPEKHNYSRHDSSDGVSAQNVTSIDLIGRPIHQLFENGDKNSSHTIESVQAVEASSNNTSISKCNLVVHCNDLLSINDDQAPLEQSRELKSSVGYPIVSDSINTKGTVDFASDCKRGTVSEDKGVSDLHNVGYGTSSMGRNIDSASGKTSFQRDTMTVEDNYERNKHSTQVGGNADIRGDSRNKKVQVAGGKKAARNTFRLGSSSSASSNSSGIINTQSRDGKETNHSIWKRRQKNTGDDCVHETQDSNHIQVPLSLASQNALLVANSAFAENNTSVPPSATCSQENSSCESNHREQRIRESKIYLKHPSYQDPIASCNQVRTDDISVQGREKPVGNSHKNAKETGKVFQAIKVGHSHSHESIQLFQEGVLNSSLQTDHPKSFLDGGSNLENISHRKAKISDTNQGDKCRSSSAPSTPHRHSDLLHSSREDFSSRRSTSSIRGTLSQKLKSSTSDSRDQQVLPIKDQGNGMARTVNISEVKYLHDERSFQSRFQKASNIVNSETSVFDENDIEHHCISQYLSEQNISVATKNAGMTRATTSENVGSEVPENVFPTRRVTDSTHNVYDSSGQWNLQLSHAPSVTYMETDSDIHKGSSKNEKSHLLDDELESMHSIQKIDMANTNLVVQTTTEENGFSCKCSSESVSEASSPDVVFKKKAQVILNSISSSYQCQVTSENIAHTIGSPLAEFEKLLYCVSPVIEPVPCTYRHGKHSRNHEITNLACRCEITDIPLKNIWNWFEQHSNYGLEVKAEDFQCSKRFGIEQNLFRAYFVPSLSGIQLFHFSDTSQSCCKGAKISASQEKNEEMESAKDFHLPQYGNLHIDTLRALLPKPSAAKETSAPVRLSTMDGYNLSSFDRKHSCSTWPEDSTDGNLEILFEYYESELPHKRKPIPEKIRELIKGGTVPGSEVFGDPHILESVKLQDLHPASWFSVAWYPIYRIPEGPLHAAFLTYHSLGHFVHRDTSSNALDRDIVDCIVTPVVGLRSYNAQAECWFRCKQFQFSSEENQRYNPMVVIRERLRTLQETASLMARGCTKEGTFGKHKDYEFFLKSEKIDVSTF